MLNRRPTAEQIVRDQLALERQYEGDRSIETVLEVSDADARAIEAQYGYFMGRVVPHGRSLDDLPYHAPMHRAKKITQL
jgi:hypothetical protein